MVEETEQKKMFGQINIVNTKKNLQIHSVSIFNKNKTSFVELGLKRQKFEHVFSNSLKCIQQNSEILKIQIFLYKKKSIVHSLDCFM